MEFSGKKFKNKIIERGYTIKGFAKKINKSEVAMHCYFMGVYVPKAKTLILSALILKCQLEDFFEGECDYREN